MIYQFTSREGVASKLQRESEPRIANCFALWFTRRSEPSLLPRIFNYHEFPAGAMRYWFKKVSTRNSPEKSTVNPPFSVVLAGNKQGQYLEVICAVNLEYMAPPKFSLPVQAVFQLGNVSHWLYRPVPAVFRSFAQINSLSRLSMPRVSRSEGSD